LKVYEYMASGRAIIASRIGQLNDVLNDRTSAMLCPPGDPTTLAEALLELERDPGLRARLGQAARAAVREHTWEAVARRILHLAGMSSTDRQSRRSRVEIGSQSIADKRRSLPREEPSFGAL
jgi:hypothetical protein